MKSSFITKIKRIHDKEIEQYKLDRNQALNALKIEEEEKLALLKPAVNKDYTPADLIKMRAAVKKEYADKRAAIMKECDEKIKEALKRQKKEKKELENALEDKNK